MKEALQFPDGFLWGAATASFQVEGGINNCDWAEAARSGRVVPAGSATDHYNRYEEDFKIAKSLGHNCHRISIEWSRIEPEEGNFNLEEIEHYKKVLQSMHENGLVPFVTLWHFTLPTWFAKRGGFSRKENIGFFVRYCEFVVSHLRGHCKNFATINESMVYSTMGYMWGQWPPFEIFKLETFLKVMKNLIRSHNEAYDVLKEKYGDQVIISIVQNNMYMHVSKFSKWNLVHHVFTKVSHWFWNEYFLNKVHKHLDVLDINYYFHTEYGKTEKYVKSDMGWDLYPQGIYHVLKHVAKYGKDIRVTEAGIADERDIYREQYIKDMLLYVHKAISEGVPVKGFMYWSLLDNYEWSHGFSKKFGLVAVDIQTKNRTIRKSAFAYKKICESNGLIKN
jgi:beta-glucosidase